MKLIDLIPLTSNSRIAIVGAGAKTSVLYALAKGYNNPVILSTSTRVSLEEVELSDQHIRINKPVDFLQVASGLSENLTFFSSQSKEHQVIGLSEIDLINLNKLASIYNYPVIIEADGAKDLWLKAPAHYEPPIPPYTNHTIVCVNSNIFGEKINDGNVHRPEILSLLLNLPLTQIIDEEIVANLILNPSGGMKNIPENSKISVFINAVNSDKKEEYAKKLAVMLENNNRITNVIQGNISYYDNTENNIKLLL